jgi:hypothetical protein
MMNLSDEELIQQLRQEGYDHFGTTYSDNAADRIDQLVATNEQFLKERDEAERNETL